MKAILSSLIQNALARGVAQGALRPFDIPSSIVFEVPKIEIHGDFSTNMAMTMASEQKKSPRQIAAIIIDAIEDGQGILAKTEIAGPGFINFFIRPEKWFEVLRSIHAVKEAYGTSQIGKGKRVQVEFVSANPTGPLHVGHGRCAAVGDTLASVLSAAGFEVQREYYINDSGRQIATLGKSVFFRYRQLHGESVAFPEDAYQGDYIKDLARELNDKHGAALLEMQEEDALEKCARYAADSILAGIEDDLKAFNVTFDTWFSEQSLFDSGDVQNAIETMKSRDIMYEKDGALWFRTTAFGDEKDRVVVRGNGLTTYFAADIAYHKNKLDRKYDRVIDVWGADHHGYIPRVSAAVQALGGESGCIGFVLVQLVNLLREGKPVAMSTRSGEFVTLREVIDEVGCDAARFIFLLRDYDSPLDFDLELAKKQSNENPVYYVQYVHARICNILRKAKERGYQDMVWQDSFPHLLHLPEEMALIRLMERYPDVVAQSARLLEPHRIPFYLRELAAAFHAYYHDRDKHKVVSDDTGLSMARLYLVSALRLVIHNGLRLMGVSAPEVM